VLGHNQMINPKEFKEGQLQRIVTKLLSYRDHPEMLQAQIQAYFVEFDADKSGNLDRHELKNFLIAFFRQYKIRIPLTEEFIDTTFADIDADGDGFVDMDELRNYMDSFLKILLDLFNDALLEHPEKMVHVDAYSLAELERVYAQLEAQEKDQEALRKTVTDYFNEFDTDKSNTLDRQELHNLIKEFFKRQDLTIPID